MLSQRRFADKVKITSVRLTADLLIPPIAQQLVLLLVYTKFRRDFAVKGSLGNISIIIYINYNNILKIF